MKCIVALSLLLAVAARASIVISQESSSTPFYQTPWAGRLRNNDLINSGTTTLGTGHTLGPVNAGFPVSGINNGTSADSPSTSGNTWIQGKDFSGGINGTWVGTFHLNTTVNTRGYEITSIESFMGWGNKGSRIQGNQTYTVAVRTVGSSTYTDIATVKYVPFTTDSAGENYESHVVLTENTSGILASGVDRIRFTFLNPHASVAENPAPGYDGTLIRELDVHGYPTGGSPPGEVSGGTKPLTRQTPQRDNANVGAVMNGARDTGSSTSKPASWFTPLWITTLVLAMACATGLLLQIRNRRQIRRLEHLHALAAERTRIARDLHDDLGAGLTQVVLLSEMACNESGEPERAKAHNEQVFTVARRLARSLDEIVWAMNPKNDTLEDSLSFVCKFAQDFLRSAGISCRLDWPEDLSDGILSSSQRHQLYLAVREVLNNVVKHAAATEVRLRLTVSHSDLVVEISDNGSGFVVPPKGVRSSRHGLDGMAERMKTAGGDIEITSAPGQGTLVRLRMPVRGPKDNT